MKSSNLKFKGHEFNHSKVLTWDTCFLAAISGVLLFLSFPKYGSGFLVWIALIPLFWAIRDTISIRQGLLLGFITGLVCHIGLLYWITYVVVNYGYLPIYLGIILMFLLACYLSLYTAVFVSGIVFFRQKIPLYLASPVLWICLEYCKSHLLTGFPWENLGYSQYLNSYLIQFADISGVFGLSFLIVLANAALFGVIFGKSKKEFILAGIVILIIAGVLIYGVSRLRQIDTALQNVEEIEVLLIQGNIDQSVKWNKTFQKGTVDIYEQLSLQQAPVEGGLIVWPETAVPFNYQDANEFKKRVNNISLRTKSWHIFGSTSFEQSKMDIDYYNSAYLISPAGEIKGKYDKVHLVPYGEYVPLRDVFPFVKKLTAGIGDFGTGIGFNPLSLDNKKIGILICYEAILPFAARMYKARSADLLVSITNDAWFGTTSAPFQHFSMAIFRAVETRLYLVRAANTGISGIIDPTGKTIAKTNIFQADALKGYIEFVRIPTFYAAYGDLLVIICFVLIIFYFFWSLKGRVRNANGKYKCTRNSK
jgi:apolipoprotein N-acyltransferase